MSAGHRKMLEQRCQTRLSEILDQLDLTGVVTMESFCQAVASWRQRPIRLFPFPLPTGLTGLWVPGLVDDTIFFDQTAPRLLVNQAIAHELGHILSGHQANGHTLSPTLISLFRHLAPERVQEALQGAVGRVTYASDEEFEAEFLGSLIERVLAELHLEAQSGSELDRVARSRMMQWTRDLRRGS